VGNATEIELLRALFARQGVEPEDADLEGVAAFVATILPQLSELEQRLPPDTRPTA
jgi:hypothetical protein